MILKTMPKRADPWDGGQGKETSASTLEGRAGEETEGHAGEETESHAGEETESHAGEETRAALPASALPPPPSLLPCPSPQSLSGSPNLHSI